MGVWRAKQEATKSIWFRVPASLKREFDELRQHAEAEGMDAAATFTAALGRLAKQLREELPRSARGGNEIAGQSGTRVLDTGTGSHSNGARTVS